MHVDTLLNQRCMARVHAVYRDTSAVCEAAAVDTVGRIVGYVDGAAGSARTANRAAAG